MVSRTTRTSADRAPVGDQPVQDPWRALSQLIAGVLLYGGLGWLADRWLGTSWIVVIGIVLGCALGMYLVYRQMAVPPEQATTDDDRPDEPEDQTP